MLLEKKNNPRQGGVMQLKEKSLLFLSLYWSVLKQDNSMFRPYCDLILEDPLPWVATQLYSSLEVWES